jgi:lysophospholipase L1-like esterase
MLGSIGYLPLLPLIAVQGLKVRRDALRLPEAEGPRSGARGRGPRLRLLVLGDSAAAGVGAKHQREALAGHLAAALAEHHRVEWQLVARTGWTVADAHAALDELGDAQYDVAVTSLGVNDVTGGRSARGYARAMDALTTRLRDRHGVGRVVCSGLPPMHLFPALPQPLRGFLGTRARALDAALAELSRADPTLVHLPWRGALDAAGMAADGFHPGPPIYREWAAAVATALLPAAARRR